MAFAKLMHTSTISVLLRGKKRFSAAWTNANRNTLAWIQERFDWCLAAFASPGFAVQIPTDEKRPEGIVEEILTRINSSLHGHRACYNA